MGKYNAPCWPQAVRPTALPTRTTAMTRIWRNNNIEIIPDEYGNKTIPSCVSFTNVSKYIGNDAKQQKDINVGNVFYEVKRLIGRDFNDKSVQDAIKFMSYSIIKNERNGISIQSSLKNNNPS